jgi:hypothetical protein
LRNSCRGSILSGKKHRHKALQAGQEERRAFPSVFESVRHKQENQWTNK